MAARGKHPVRRRWRYSRLPGKRRPGRREGRRPSTNIGAICSGSSRAIWTTRIRPPATIWSWLIEARAGCCARRAGSAASSRPPDTICRSEWARTAGSGNSIRLSKARSTPKFPTSLSSLRASSPSPKPGDILLSQQFVDDAQRYGYRFEEEGFVARRRSICRRPTVPGWSRRLDFERKRDCPAYPDLSVREYRREIEFEPLVDRRKDAGVLPADARATAHQGRGRTREADVRQDRRRGRSGRSPCTWVPAGSWRLCASDRRRALRPLRWCQPPSPVRRRRRPARRGLDVAARPHRSPALRTKFHKRT